MYLWKKESGYFFQIRMPIALGGWHVRIWLGQIAKSAAKRHALALAGYAKVGFELGMDRETLTQSLKAIEDELKALDKETSSVDFAVFAAKTRLSMADEVGMSLLPEEVAANEQKLAVYSARQKTLLAMRERIERLGKVIERDADALSVERTTYDHVLRQLSSMSAAQPIQAVAEPPQPVSRAVQPDEYSDEREITADTLLSVAGRVVLDLRREAKGQVGVRDRYQDRLESSLNDFIDIIGDKPLRKYLPMHMQDFATVMAKCPKNRSKYPQFKGLSIRECVQVNAKSKKPLDTLSSTAVRGRLSEIAGIWVKATAGISEVKDLGTYRVTMPQGARKATVREGLPVSSLNVWMKAAAALPPRDDHRKYMPLLALLTGLRLGEIAWLQPRDIVEIDGHTVIDLRTPLVIDRKSIDRALKTETSPRIVALHPFLKDAGFIEFARKRRQWIFGEFHRSGDPARSAQRQMAYWMRTLGIHSDQRHVFHSLRHNAKHWLRGISGDTGKLIADRQCGHAPSNVADSYGFAVLQSDEIAKIEALPLPSGVDFEVFLSGR